MQTTWDANYGRTDRDLGLGGRLIANYNLLLTDTGFAEMGFTEEQIDDVFTATSKL